MTILSQIAAGNNSEFGGVLPGIVRCLIKTGGDFLQAAAMAEAGGASPAAAKILKAAVTGGGLNNATWARTIAGWPGVTEVFLQGLGGRSAFSAMLAAGILTKAPLRSKVGSSITGAVGAVTDEGRARAVTKMALADEALDPAQADALIVLSREVVEQATAQGDAFVARQLRRALAGALDAGFLDKIVDGSTIELPSVGAGVAAMRSDVKALLDVVNSGEGRLALMAAPDVCSAASVLDPNGTARPEGVSALFGVSLFCSPSMEPGVILALDGDRVAADIVSLGLDLASETSLEMNSAPTGSAVTPTGSPLVSLWQTNSIGLKLSALFGAVRGTDDAVATITDVDWVPTVS